MAFALLVSLLAAQPATCSPVSLSATLDVAFKKGARVKDVVGWLSKVNCAEYDVWPGLENNALTLVVEGKLQGTSIELLGRALLESGGARLESVGGGHRIRRRLGPCDPVAARAALASARSSKTGCVLDLTRFGAPATVAECLSEAVKLVAQADGKLLVEQLGADAMLRAIGVEEGDLLVEPLPEPPDRFKAGPSNPLSLSVVRAGKPMTLACTIVGDGESLALHPGNALRLEAREACELPESAVMARGDVMEISSHQNLTPECLMRAARFVPVTREGGFSVKVYAVRSGSFFARLGFANGDEVRAINGALLPRTPEELVAKLKGQERFVIDFVRRGETKTVTIVKRK